ncbi:hypothetical protein PAPHI01_1112 [Pancytospora philotis]|nr:hypothetical protein PAPHI01_1112 [Pancytospora philotis]
MSYARSLGLTQFVEINSARIDSVDLILYIYQLKSFCNRLLTNLSSELIRIWTSDYAKRHSLVPMIQDALSTALRFRVFNQNEQYELKYQIFDLAISTCEQEYFDFCLKRYGRVGFAKQVMANLQTNGRGDANAPFMLKFIKYIEGTYDRPGAALSSFFTNYLPPTSEFHTVDSIWNCDSECFNSISPSWLTTVFVELYTDHEYVATRDEFMHKVMKIMKYKTLIKITRAAKDVESRGLVFFMLKDVNETTRVYYRRKLEQSDGAHTNDNFLRAAKLHIAAGLEQV